MIVVVGPNSFIARQFLNSSVHLEVASVRHSELDKLEGMSGVDCIVNFAFAPELYTHAYKSEFDIDKKLGAFAAEREIHYVMISSRKVYSHDAQWNALEDAQATGQDAYGRNKRQIENTLSQLLGNRLTILRPGNVFGFERQPGRTRFGAYLLNQLANNGEIRLTLSPFVRRDVVPVDYFCEVLQEVVVRKPSGIFNVGAGHATEIGKVALWMLEGFGRGKLIVESAAEVDEFQLDSRRLASEFGLTCNAERIRHFSRSLGSMLSKEIERHD